MTRPYRVLILGDSVFASAGAVLPNALDMLVSDSGFNKAIEIYNGSAIGMTSADARSHLEKLLLKQHFDILVVHVGHCDACSYGKPKPALHSFARKYRLRRLDKTKRNNIFSRRTPPLTFQYYPTDHNPLVRSVPESDFYLHLQAIIRMARQRHIPVILFNPISQRHFPPCNNTGNFIFYQIPTLPHRLTLTGEIPAPLALAMTHHHSGDFKQAVGTYDHLLQEEFHQDLIAIAAVNKAAIECASGHLTQAMLTLDHLQPDIPLFPLVLYARAAIFYAQGRILAAHKMLDNALGLDTGSYRISPPYRQQIKQLSNEFAPTVKVIDLHEIVMPEDIMDYCHPTLSGHQRMAEALVNTVQNILGLSSGPIQPTLKVLALNPDFYTGAQDDFFHYFGITPIPDQNLALRLVAASKNSDYDIYYLNKDFFLETDIFKRLQQRLMIHPVFGSEEFLRALPPTASADQGTLPEFYILRHIQAAFNWFEEQPALLTEGLIPQENRLRRWWPLLASNAPIPAPPQLLNALEGIDAKQALQRIAKLFIRSTDDAPTVNERLRSITYWFMREALIFGTPSHYLMYTDRKILQHVLTSALILAYAPCYNQHIKIKAKQLLAALSELIAIHQQHLHPIMHTPLLFSLEKRQHYADHLAQFRQSHAFAKVREMASAI